MAGILLKRIGTGATLLALGGCAYATPYPAAFPDTTGPRLAPADSGRSDGCEAAIGNPGSPTLVLRCLRSRGQAWDNRGRAIRQQSGYVGQLSIPLGIAGLGLSAAGDRSDFVPLSAGVSSAALAHTGAYARPTQAEVYELATASYRCLLGAVADWNGAGQSAVVRAFTAFVDSSNAALDAVRAAEHLTVTERAELRRKLLAQQASARHTGNTLDGGIGTALLRQSDEIDAAVIRAIRDRLPDPQAVAASIAASAGPIEDTPTVAAPPTLKKDADDAAEIQLANSRKSGGPDVEVTARQAEAARIAELIDEATFDADAFDAAVEAYAGASRTVSTTCAFNPSLLPVLTVTPTEITVDGAGKGFFIVRNGVPPYGHLPLPAEIALAPTPLGGNAMRYEVTATGEGTWKIHIIDASPGGGVAEVTVTRTEAPST